MKRNLLRQAILIAGLLNAHFATADLSVNANSWPKQAPTKEYEAQDYYSNGQASSFKQATVDNRSIITATEQDDIDARLPASDLEKWYLKVGMYKGTAKTTSVKNKSTDATLSGFSLSSTKASKDITGGQIGVGYVFGENYRGDIEYLFANDGEYNQAPLFARINGVGGWPDLTSKITGQHVIANAYYDFSQLYLFKPFIGAALGVGMNKATSNFTRVGGVVTAGAGKTKTTMGLDYGLQVGARMQVLKSRLQVNASYRYLSLGKVKWLDSSENLVLQGKRTVNGFGLDLIFLL